MLDKPWIYGILSDKQERYKPVTKCTYWLVLGSFTIGTLSYCLRFGHGKEFVDGLNDVDKRYIYQLMSKVQLPGSVIFDSHIKMHTGTEKKDVSLAQ